MKEYRQTYLVYNIIIKKMFILKEEMKLKEIYLDNSATTVTCQPACKKVLEMLSENYGNPSSLHLKGMQAEKELIEARKTIADKIKCKESEIVFTSGGTEANNLAVIGACERRKKLGNRVIVSAIEHSSVISSAKELEDRGFNVVYVKPDKFGRIDEKEIEKELSKDTIFVSLMYVNNEVGSIQPVEKIKKMLKVKSPNAIFHVDAVQAFGKIDISVKKIDADLMTITAHKIHGPKGVGALYIRKGILLKPLVFGGEQEYKIRPGTQAISLIAGFAEAVKDLPKCKDEYEHISSLRDYLVSELKKIESVRINSGEDSFPYIVNFSVLGIRSEIMLHHLEENGIYVSSGSACAKGQKSHVLKSMDLDDEVIDSAIRVSFSKYNTKEDINSIVDSIKSGITRIRKGG